MDARLIASAVFAVLVASCSGGVYDSSDFKPSVTTATTTATADPAPPAGGADDPAGAAKAEDTVSAPADVAAAALDEPPAAKDEATPATVAADAATAAPESTAPAVAAAQPEAGGLLAFLRTPAPTPAVEAADRAVDSAPGADTAGATDDTADADALPIEDLPPEEFSEAELAGEQEADPTKVAVPEEPIDDGLEHDFVNVYTSKPEAQQPTIDGLPGVEWQSGLVLVSRTPDGDPSELFGGDHPFARTVPGIPRQTIQAANGLLLAHSAISVSCIKPNLLNLVRRAESHFGKKVVVTSGYRSPSHNRRVRGATHSQHLYCNALDLYMPGVARDDLARFFFAQPDRGGIGLYCHTRSIHIDTGKRRQWRWSCRRRAG
jgi:hypothetical protein